MRAGAESMRTEITYPGKIKKIGNAYYVNVPKDYVQMLAAEDGTEVDVNIKLVQRAGIMSENAVTRPRAQGWG